MHITPVSGWENFKYRQSPLYLGSDRLIFEHVHIYHLAMTLVMLVRASFYTDQVQAQGFLFSLAN